MKVIWNWTDTKYASLADFIAIEAEGVNEMRRSLLAGEHDFDAKRLGVIAKQSRPLRNGLSIEQVNKTLEALYGTESYLYRAT